MKGKQMRRRKADSSDEEDGGGSNDDDHGVKKKTLAELREEQKQRKVKTGIQAASTLDVGEEGTTNKASKKKTAEEEEEEEAEKQRSIGEMMESNFTGMKYVKKDETSVHDRIMEQYINDKLGVKKPEIKEDLPPAKLTRRDKLMAITEDINARGRPAEQQQQPRGGGNDEESGVGEGAPIAYSTGIAEVALPMEFKMRNIEATEKARKQHEEELRHGGGKSGGAAGGGGHQEVIGNATTNYHHHRREYAIEMRGHEARGGGGSDKPKVPYQRKDGEGPQGRSQVMTDDAVYDRFKKRARR